MKDLRKPRWLKKRITPIEDILKVKSIQKKINLQAVCQEARCPNRDECFPKDLAPKILYCDKHQ